MTDVGFWEKIQMDTEGSKSPKMTVLGFWQKHFFGENVFLLQYESANGLLTLCKNNIFELWSKNRKTNQNAGLFKLQYLTNKLRYIWSWIVGCD